MPGMASIVSRTFLLRNIPPSNGMPKIVESYRVERFFVEMKGLLPGGLPFRASSHAKSRLARDSCIGNLVCVRCPLARTLGIAVGSAAARLTLRKVMELSVLFFWFLPVSGQCPAEW